MATDQFNAKEYWENRLKTHKGLEGVGFTSLGKYFNIYAYKARKHCFLTALKDIDFNPKESKVADIGSGIGYWIETLDQLKTKEIYGFDITTEAVLLLTNKFPNHTFQQLDIGKQIPDSLKEKFDVITCMDVLFHIVDDKAYLQAFKNINSMLKPGGFFICSEYVIPKEKKAVSSYFVMKTKEEFDKIINESRFELVKSSPYMQIINIPANTNNFFLKYLWKILLVVIPPAKIIGLPIALAMYPFELLMLKISKKPLGMQIFTFRKK
jgi:2-polyprenyl-3-methyl-5-hydroxy-6-metoxy-1,4-benzoquinol methylase